MGAGAVGCYFGGMLARAGASVTMIGRSRHVDAITRDGLFLDTMQFQERVLVTATTDVAAVRDAEIVLLCVKTLDTEDAAQAMMPYVSRDGVVMSLQNGVDNVERIDAAAGIHAIAAVVYVAAEMIAPGRVKHSGRGDLRIGDVPSPRGSQTDSAEYRHRARSRLDQLAALFTRASVPCVVTDNIAAELWTKLIMNCAYNPISALCRARYGRIVHNPWTREIMRQVAVEAMAVAHAAGVRFTDGAMVDTVHRLGEAMAGATSSTAQDIARGKPTEIDSLNGYVARRGAELGVPAPVNQTLHALVKLLEDPNRDKG
jgi:2-dehydropantoate 2-reductase